ncbi:MAG: alpha-N-acetylglucosaminidase [Fimbriimonadaceae bacterium]|nr:alpha-N-acetylglucosaminidase [Fimbriimonadaceae bacterium]
MRAALLLSLVLSAASTLAAPTIEAVRALLVRRVPAAASKFDLTLVEDRDNPWYEIEASEGRVRVRGNTPVALCRGAYDYLRDGCQAMITWGGANVSHVRSPLPDLAKRRVQSPFRFVLQDNVCAFGYTTAFYQWPDWERYLDVMALHGGSAMFAPVGSEAIWAKVWKSYGVTDEELGGYFTGPAFLPWHRMGNLNKHDGPLLPSYLRRSVALQKKILARMRDLGIEPIAPAFAGFVPKGFKRARPDANVLPMKPWAGFEGDHQSWILHPLSPLYAEIGGRFIKEWQAEFGDADLYLADSFNEMEVPVSDDRATRLAELEQFGDAVYSAIKAGDPEGTWVMQGWLFFNARDFWDAESRAALLRRVPDDKMIVLDLYTEAIKVWKLTDAFHGKRWVMSTIPNWGGQNTMAGSLALVAPLAASTVADPARGNLVGFGISAEGTENNEVVHELLFESAWSTRPIDLQTWLPRYARARYGTASAAAEEAWRLLSQTVYARDPGTHSLHLLQQRPANLGIGTRGRVNNSKEFRRSVERLLVDGKSLSASALYRNDVIESVAQWTLLVADDYLRAAVVATGLGDEKSAREAFQTFMELVARADRFYASHPLYRLDRWTRMARSWGDLPREGDRYEEDAKRQITVWGGPVLSEYAAKVWSGLLTDYYANRWRAWIEGQWSGTPLDVRRWEEAWITRPGVKSPTPIPDVVESANAWIAELKQYEAEVPGDFSMGAMVGRWTRGQIGESWTTVEWPLPDSVTTSGDVIVRFQYEEGAHRLEIRRVRLVVDGETVAVDEHNGRTGTEDVANDFRLRRPEKGKATIVADVRCDGGADSSGGVFLRSAK